MYILEDLWLGQVAPIEESVPKSKAYGNALRQITDKQEMLEQLLPKEAEGLLSAYNDAQIMLQDFAERAAFAQGFRLGAKIMLDVLEKEQI